MAVCQEFPQGGCYPGDGHGLQGKGPQPPLHRRAGQPRPGLSQGRGVLPPHPAAAGAGEAPHAYHQLRGPPPHRHMGQTSGQRRENAYLALHPTGTWTRRQATVPRDTPWAPQALQNGSSNPIGIRHSITARCTVRCWPTAVSSRASRPRKVVRSGSVKVVSGTSRSLVTVV